MRVGVDAGGEDEASCWWEERNRVAETNGG